MSVVTGMAARGTELPIPNVRSSVANGGKAAKERTIRHKTNNDGTFQAMRFPEKPQGKPWGSSGTGSVHLFSGKEFGRAESLLFFALVLGACSAMTARITI
jgi:hypothetical protein